MNRATTHASLALLVLGVAACSSTPVAPPPAPSKPPMAAQAPAPAPAPAAPVIAPKPVPASTVTAVTLPEYLDPKSSIASQRSVFFDFDVFAVRSEDSPLIERHGKYLASHPAVAIKIEGNTDERGGVEYNLALGQKRAESVLRALRLLGVKDAQMEAVSWGESKPAAAGHDEASWAKNRRVDLQYPKK